MRDDTAAVHAGVDKDATYNSVTTPIYPSSTFRFDDVGSHRGYDYTRSGNPDAQRRSKRTSWPSKAGRSPGRRARAWPRSRRPCSCCGRATTWSRVTISTAAPIGCSRPSCAQFGISFSFVDMSDEAAVRAAVRPETRMLWIETPSNPLLHIVDIRAMVAIGRERGLLTVADNTFLSPYFQRPLALGSRRGRALDHQVPQRA